MIFAEYSATGSITVDISTTDHKFAPELGKGVRGLYIGGAGDVVVVMNDKSAATFKNVVAGSILPIQILQVTRAGTTATNLLALV